MAPRGRSPARVYDEDGNEEMEVSRAMPTEFEMSFTDEPHATRRKLIQAKYPQVKELFGPHWLTKWLVMLTVSIQIGMASVMSELSWPWVIVCAYTIGGVINHGLTLAMHEISHNLAFHSLFLNRVIGMVANVPLGIPAFVQFKRYHREHHKNQGEDGIDTDIPTEVEGNLVKNTLGKIIWVFLQPLFYSLRPMLVCPKIPGMWEAMNWSVVLAADYTVYHFFGIKAVVYMVAGTLLGMGMHPMAGHFIAEHYTFIKHQETYSYYGPLNWFSYNVGYHNEHHDFPFVSGFRLPALRAMAPEFYDNIPHHSSWTKVIFEYIFDPTVGPFSRVKRNRMDPETRARITSGKDA